MPATGHGCHGRHAPAQTDPPTELHCSSATTPHRHPQQRQLHMRTSRRSTSALATLPFSWASSRFRPATCGRQHGARGRRAASVQASIESAPNLSSRKRKRWLESCLQQPSPCMLAHSTPATSAAAPLPPCSIGAHLEPERPNLGQPVAVLRLAARQRALLQPHLLVQQAHLLVAAHQLWAGGGWVGGCVASCQRSILRRCAAASSCLPVGGTMFPLPAQALKRPSNFCPPAHPPVPQAHHARQPPRRARASASGAPAGRGRRSALHERSQTVP